MKNSFLKNKSIKSFLDFFSRLSISAIFISAIPGKINEYKNTKKELDEFIKGINLEYKSIKKEINDFF